MAQAKDENATSWRENHTVGGVFTSRAATTSSNGGRKRDLQTREAVSLLVFSKQIQLDREAKKESLDRELAARLAVVELQKRNEDLKIFTFSTTGMNPEDAARIEALKEKARAT
nr:hypothetical protein [Tanacetum cinerariifolium]